MSNDDVVVLLPTDTAEELLDLVRDQPGLADEDALDDAKARLADAEEEIPGPDQQRVAEGDAIAFGLSPADAEVVTTLIEDNVETNRKTLRSVGRTIKSKLKIARKKQKEHSGRRRRRK